MDNHDFDGGYDGWDATPISFQSPVDGENLGWAYNQGDMLGTARDWKNEYSDLTLSTTVTVPEDTTKLIIAPSLIYVENFSGIDAAYTCTMSVGTTAGGTDIWTHSFNEKDYQVGYAYNINTPLSGLNIAADTVLYITVKIAPSPKVTA